MALRNTFLAAAAIIISLGTLPACQNGNPFWGPSSVKNVDPLEVLHAGLKERWTHTIGLASGEKIAQAWRVGDAIYVTTSRSFLVSIDASSGVRRWTTDMGDSTHAIYRPVEVPALKAVIIADKGNVLALDKMTGSVLARTALGFTATTDPFVIDDTLCLGGSSYFYGLYLDPFGGRKWVTSAPADYFIARPAQIGTSALVIASGKEGKLWRITPVNGEWDWRDRKVAGPIIAPLAVDGRHLYVASLDNRLYAFDQATSAHVWDTRLEGRLSLGPVPATPSVLLCPTEKGSLYALTTEKGLIKWSLPGIDKIGTIVGDRVFVVDNHSQLLGVLLETGEVISTLSVPGVHSTVTNRADGLVYTIFKDGRVMAFEQNR